MGILDSDRLLKRIWLANGLLILLGLVLAGGVALFALISNAIGRRAEAVAAPATVAEPGTRADPRAVRYSMPQEVRATSTRLIHVFHGEAYARTEGYDGSRRQYSLYTSEGPTVNVIFLRPDGTAHLLLDRPAFVRALDYPDPREDSLQRWIAYEIVTDDSNGDRRLDDQDAAILYLSDVDGTNFRRVMPEGWAVTSHIALQPGQLLISAIRAAAREGDKADEQPQRAFIYDLTTNTLVPQVSLDSIADRAGRVLSRPRP